MNMYHIELTKPNGSNIKTNIPARDVVELQKIVDKQYAGYKLKVMEVVQVSSSTTKRSNPLAANKTCRATK